MTELTVNNIIGLSMGVILYSCACTWQDLTVKSKSATGTDACTPTKVLQVLTVHLQECNDCCRQHITSSGGSLANFED